MRLLPIVYRHPIIQNMLGNAASIRCQSNSKLKQIVEANLWRPRGQWPQSWPYSWFTEITWSSALGALYSLRTFFHLAVVFKKCWCIDIKLAKFGNKKPERHNVVLLNSAQGQKSAPFCQSRCCISIRHETSRVPYLLSRCAIRVHLREWSKHPSYLEKKKRVTLLECLKCRSLIVCIVVS